MFLAIKLLFLALAAMAAFVIVYTTIQKYFVTKPHDVEGKEELQGKLDELAATRESLTHQRQIAEADKQIALYKAKLAEINAAEEEEEKKDS